VERNGRDAVAAFLVDDEPLIPGGTLSLGDAVSRHVRVRRLGVGARLALLDGQGHRAVGTLVRLAPSTIVEVERVAVTPPAPPVHLLVPIADRDRMLWMAEKAVELAGTSWRPVLYRRSRSVKPRGEGPTFMAKVKARMAAALEQSDGTWLPAIFPESTVERALAALPAEGTRIVLDASGAATTALPLETLPVVLAVGPEGGFEEEELDLFERQGFARGLIGGGILRWESAAIAGLAIIRTRLVEARVHV
jgi:16S rRNA (uracil1498-N3)-methyltransferase